MYFKSIKVENVGPIEDLDFSFEFCDEGNPKPLVIVGENGSGKSILVSHLINTLMSAKQEEYEDSEIESNRVYKLRTANYIKTGKNYYFTKTSLTNDICATEWHLDKIKKDFENEYGYTPANKDWNILPNDSNSIFSTNFEQKKEDTKKLVRNNCLLYFPVNRFEEPAWLNMDNLKQAADYTDLKNLTGYSNRQIISLSPLKHNRNWLLDLLLDRWMFDSQLQNIQVNSNGQLVPVTLFQGFNGISSNLVNSINRLLQIILRTNKPVSFATSTRRNRKISIKIDGKDEIPDLFQLSTGETQLLNLFLSIIRDFDLCDTSFETLNEVTGIVVVDEIDAHLHSVYQSDVLPQLIQTFPKVQFILTSHSPLFLSGLKNILGDENFNIIEMPTGDKINCDDFIEFESAVAVLKDSKQYKKQLNSEIQQLNQPTVYAEGDYDVRYIKKACELLNKSRLIQEVTWKDGDGETNLKKIWNNRKLRIFDALKNKTILLYDCEINIQESEHNKLIQRVIPLNDSNPIKIGIENLFPQQTIDRLRQVNSRFVNYKPEVKLMDDGKEVIEPEVYSLNKGQKKNICDWLCENGTVDDFYHFQGLLDNLEKELL